jgi:polyisoprenoid-binding protein YceI
MFVNLIKKSSIVAVLSAATISASVAYAQAQAPFSKDFTAQPAGEYVLDKSHASVTWRISHLGLSQYTARFDKMDGKIQYTPATSTASKVEFTIDATSVNTGLAPFNKKLQAPEYFDAEKNPSITFKSTKIEPIAGGKFKMIGDMTLRGVTKPMTWDVTFNGGVYNRFAQAHAVGFSAKGIVKRTDWGMKELVPMIGDDVEVIVEVEFNNRNTAQ